MPVRTPRLLAAALLAGTLGVSTLPASVATASEAGSSTTGSVDLLPSSLTLAADPPEVFAGFPTRLGGQLTSTGAVPAGETLLVHRGTAGAAGAPLPSVTTRNDGTFVVDDTPPGPGTWTYTVVWQGDSTRARVQATADVVVRPASTTTVELSLRPSPESSAIVLGGVVLSDPDHTRTVGRSVYLKRGDAWLYAQTTSPNGAATFKDQPGPGTHTYTAYLMATPSSGQPEAASSATITVPATAPTTLSATAPATGTAGDALTVSGQLSTVTAALSGARVDVVRTGCGSGWSATATTAADGRWSVVDPAPNGGTCAYSASYAGSALHDSSQARASSVVALRPADLTLTVTRGTGSTKKLAYVTARLGGWRSNRTVVVTAQSGTAAPVVLLTGEVSASGLLTVTHTPKTATTYRVHYAGDEWYAGATASRTS